MVFKKGHKLTKKVIKKMKITKNSHPERLYRGGGITSKKLKVKNKIKKTIKKRYKEGTKMGFQCIEKVSHRRYYKKNKCEQCGSIKSLVVHHIDANQSNHLLTNLETLCRSCHISKHYQPYMRIGKIFKFEAAHHLFGVPPCDRLHGHSFKMEVVIGGRLNKQAMVMNFKDIKRIVEKNVINILDHNEINTKIGMKMPTSENLLIWAFSKLNSKIKGLKEITIWETENSFATITDEYFLDMLGE